MTLVPAVSDALITFTSTTALSAVGVNILGLVSLNAPPEVGLFSIKMSDGSKSHVPALPNTLDALTLPNACRLSCELVSTNPPLPVPAPLA